MPEDKYYTVEDLEPLSIARSVCLRPLMYTANGTLEEVIALLSGYIMGIQHSRTTPVDQSPADAIEWFAKKCEIPLATLSPKERTELIIKSFGSSEEALSELNKFLEERSKSMKHNKTR